MGIIAAAFKGFEDFLGNQAQKACDLSGIFRFQGSLWVFKGSLCPVEPVDWYETGYLR
ncbi:MAG: hypothetical protein ACI8Z1_000131 [Candidatus Azotimanducaceae bacterium]|jgi:hypothetical protein